MRGTEPDEIEIELYRKKGEIIKFFDEALEEQRINPETIQFLKIGSGKNAEIKEYSLNKVLAEIGDIADSITIFQQNAEFGKWNKKLDPEERVYIIAKVIIRYLYVYGEFIIDQYGILHYFCKSDRKIYTVCEDVQLRKINPLFEGKIEFDFNLRRRYPTINMKILNMAYKEHIKKSIYRLWYYDKDQKVLFIYSGNNGYYKLNGTTIEKCINGTDIIFKESRGIEPKEYIPKQNRSKIENIVGLFRRVDVDLFDVIINRTNFDERSNLSADEQRVQLIIHLLILPFASIINTKPIMIFHGESESGKSFILRSIGKLLFNVEFKVSALAETPKDYMTALINRPVYFTDNVDDYIKWLPEIVVAIATGALIPQRRLYSNTDLIESHPASFMAFTTRTGYSFKREDLISRTLLFHVKKIEEFEGEDKIWNGIDDNRNQLFSEYMDILNEIVYFLRSNPDFSITTRHRIADWVNLAFIINHILDLETIYNIRFDLFLEHLKHEKSAYGLRDKNILPILKQIAYNYPNMEFTASEIVEKSLEFGDELNYDIRKIGKILGKYQKELEILLGLDIVYNAHSKTKRYIFRRLEDGEENKKINSAVFAVSDSTLTRTREKKNNFCTIKGTHTENIPQYRENRSFESHSKTIKDRMYELETFISKDKYINGISFEELEQYFVHYKKWEKSDLEFIIEQLLNYSKINEEPGNRYKLFR